MTICISAFIFCFAFFWASIIVTLLILKDAETTENAIEGKIKLRDGELVKNKLLIFYMFLCMSGAMVIYVGAAANRELKNKDAQIEALEQRVEKLEAQPSTTTLYRTTNLNE